MSVIHRPAVGEEPRLEFAAAFLGDGKLERWGGGGAVLERAAQACLLCGDRCSADSQGRVSGWVQRKDTQGFSAPDCSTSILHSL